MTKDEKNDIPDKVTATSDKIAKEINTQNADKLKTATSYIEMLSKIFGLLTWQVIVLLIIVLFYTPLRQMVELLPEKFARSNEINVGVLSLKIQEEAIASGNEELATIINGLSEDEIRELIFLGGSISHRVVGSGNDKYILDLSKLSIWNNLIERDLVKSTVNRDDFEKIIYSLNPETEGSDLLIFQKENLTKEQVDKLTDNYVELTDTGQRAYDIIINVIVGLIAEK